MPGIGPVRAGDRARPCRGSGPCLFLVYSAHKCSPVTISGGQTDGGLGGRVAQRPSRYGLRSLDEADARPERPPSLAEHVCRVIREDILTGRQPASARLTEAMVMERTGVSRTPVREGLRTLEGEGLVVTYRSRGTFVTYRQRLEEAKLIYEVRLVIEPPLTALAAERMTAEDLAMVEDVLARFVDALDAAEAREAGQLDAEVPPGDLRGQRQRGCSAWLPLPS